MKKTIRIKTLAACISLCLLCSSAIGLGVVREFQGSRSFTTTEFVVQAPWLLDWRVNGDYSNALGFEIDLMDGRTGLHAGQVLKTKRVGNGVKLFNTGGRYRLRINASLANYHIKIQEISKEDAEQYTPRGGD